MKYDGIIFDWAGTTVDYGSFAPVKAFIEAFEKFQINLTLDEVRKPMGMLKIDHIRTIMSMKRINNLWVELYGKEWTKEDVEKVYTLSESKIMEILSDFSCPKPYVIETIKKIRENGLKIGATTGYTNEMMKIIAPKAKELGYEPDYFVTPDCVGKYGRPYPYMIFKNMQELKLQDVSKIMKVGDTVSDIKEGKNAGVVSVGIIEGSSAMGLKEDEYNKLTNEEKEKICEKTSELFFEAGADYVVKDIRGILELLD